MKTHKVNMFQLKKDQTNLCQTMNFVLCVCFDVFYMHKPQNEILANVIIFWKADLKAVFFWVCYFKSTRFKGGGLVEITPSFVVGNASACFVSIAFNRGENTRNESGIRSLFKIVFSITT